MPKNAVRERINELWKKVFVTNEIRPSDDLATRHEVEDEELSRHNITRIPFELEAAEAGVMSCFYFNTLKQSHLMEHRPSEDSLDAAQFVDYATHTSAEFQQTYLCGSGLGAQIAYILVSQWARCTAIQAFQTSGLVLPVKISIPNPFFLLFSGSFFYPFGEGGSRAGNYLEPAWENDRPMHPHITIATTQDFSGHDNSMLWGELAPLVKAMYSRANQPLVPDVEEMERLGDEGARNFPGKPRVFGGERRFPVIMLSFLENQYGRIFYAHMRERQLVIHQSRLYSFQTRDDAIVELFVRFLLSSPSSW